MSSIFSKIVSREIPAYIVAEDENYLAFLDIFPLQKGHVLVIPKVEVDYIFDLDQATYTGLMSFARKVAIKLKKVVDCNRIGMVVIGLEVAHAHVHLIPINRERDMNFSNPKKEFTKEEMEAIARLIKEA
jgi:histidine triad (HIT) family protein